MNVPDEYVSGEYELGRMYIHIHIWPDLMAGESLVVKIIWTNLDGRSAEPLRRCRLKKEMICLRFVSPHTQPPPPILLYFVCSLSVTVDIQKSLLTVVCLIFYYLIIIIHHGSKHKEILHLCCFFRLFYFILCYLWINSYVHRVGRTARAGREGYAVTFVTDNDRSLLKAIVKRAGSKLKSRIVAEQSITKWSQVIEQMEDQVASVLREEREEMALRKAEMEADKAENMITHRDEIFSRPKRTWFVTEKEKKLVANAGKETEKGSKKTVMSAEEAEERKKKEKKKREHEKNLPRKKRRKLEASREMLEDEGENGGSNRNKKEKPGISLVDLAYRRAKAAKGAKKAVDAGKAVRTIKKGAKKSSTHLNKSRPEEMKELFQSDMSEKKQKRSSGGKKSSFKSKSRYKRR